MVFRAVIFDLDGTLLDTIRDIADSMNEVLKRMGFPIYKTEDYYYFVGEGMKALCEKVIPKKNHTSELIAECVKLMKSEYQKNWYKNTKPYPGISNLLKDLQTKNIKMAVHSNKPDEFTKLFIKRFFPDITFTAVIGESPNFPKKPAPDGALHLARIMALRPVQVIYLGDSDIDMKTAIAAGMYPVGALWGFRTAEELMDAGAKKLIKTPEELLKII
ncbi:MAG: HAD family hydrolase [candidate division WOR-3 bacterium]